MTNDEFEKIWRLLSSLFPSAAAKKSKVDIVVWRKGLEPYAMSEVSDRIMTYAQRNKYFPDLADITGNLLQKDAGFCDIERMNKLYEKMKSKSEQREVVAQHKTEPEIQERKAYDFDCQKCRHNTAKPRLECEVLLSGKKCILWVGDDDVMRCREFKEEA